MHGTHGGACGQRQIDAFMAKQPRGFYACGNLHAGRDRAKGANNGIVACKGHATEHGKRLQNSIPPRWRGLCEDARRAVHRET